MTSRKEKSTLDSYGNEHQFVRTLLDTSNSLIVCLDKDARITIFNRECEKVTGYKAEEVLGESWPAIFMPKGHLSHQLDNFADWVRLHPRDTYEGPLKTKSGKIRTILWSNSAIFGPGEDEITAVAIGQDITERKRAEEKLRRTHRELEKRVQERTSEIVKRNIELKKQIESRQRAEKALLESEQRYEMATSAGRVGVWDWDLITNEMYIDPKLKAMLGYEDHEIRNSLDDWGQYVHPDDTSEVMAEVENYRAGRTKKYEVIHRMMHKDGSVRWILARGTFIRDKNGKPVRMIGTDTDVTDRIRAEKALKENQERFKKLSDAAEEGIVIHENGHIVDANEACARMFGYELEEFIGRHVKDTAIPETWDDIRKHIETRDGSPYEGICVRKDGTQFECNIVGKPYDYQGRSMRVAVLRDISWRKKAEKELLNTKQRLDHLISSSPAVIYSCGPPPDFPTTFISTNIQERLGYSPQDFYDDPFFWSKQIHPDDSERISARLAELDNKGTLTYEYRFRLKNGKYVWLFDELSVMRDDKGEIGGLIGSWFDITDRKEAESRLRETADQLRVEQTALSEKNIALKEILNHIERERKDYKRQICYDVEKAIKPLMGRLKAIAGKGKEKEIESLELSLKSILQRDIDVFRDRFSRLSPRELEICQLIKQGKSSKQISQILSLALVTVHKHRELIRKKLGLTNKNINLSSYLQNQDFPNNT